MVYHIGMKTIGISSCLLGNKVRYDGQDMRNEKLLKLLEGHKLIPLCPETMGGLETPRFPCEISNNIVINSENENKTAYFLKGSNICLDLIRNCDFVILKQKSPSCGYGKIYDGSFSGKLIKGNGIFTRLCLENKIKVFSEEDLEEIKKFL